MLPGDIVVEINGVKVHTSEEIYQAVRNSDQITMMVQRGHELVKLQMTPEYTEWHPLHDLYDMRKTVKWDQITVKMCLWLHKHEKLTTSMIL